MPGNKQKQLVYQLLDELFDEPELDSFSATYFKPAYQRFSPGLARSSKIRLLVEACVQAGELGQLVKKVQQVKPAAYQAFVQRAQSQAEPAAPTRTERAQQPVQASPAAAITPPDPVKILERLEGPATGQLAGRYSLDRTLNATGQGAVFKAYDSQLDLHIAIKLIDLDRIEPADRQKQVEQNVRTITRLNHPGVIRVYDSDRVDDWLYIVMEFIPGFNLEEIRRRFPTADRQNLAKVLQFVVKLCQPVHYMHQQGVFHPSLAPDNIMLKPAPEDEALPWQPVLINFALLSRARGQQLPLPEISAEQLIYQVTPELLLERGPDARSDVYSLGVLLYDLVVGRPPFISATLDQAVQLHSSAPLPPPRSINPQLPEPVSQIILKAMARNPADRYNSAEELAGALADCLDTLDLSLPQPRASIAIMIMEERPLQVTPGETLTTTVLLRNDSQEEHYCRLQVQGIPDNWLSIAPSATTLAPAEAQKVTLTIQPPWSPLSRAGQYPLLVQVISQQDLGQHNQLQQILTVAPYFQLQSRLWPQEIIPDQTTQVILENLGNSAETANVKPDPPENLVVEPDYVEITVPPGQKVALDFKLSLRQKVWVGKTTQQTFSVKVEPSRGTAETLTGQFVSRALLSPEWAFGIALLVILFCCAVLAIAGTMSGLL